MNDKEGYNVTVKPLVTLQGLMLVVRDEEGDKWRFPEIELDYDESIDRTAEKGLKDLLDLEVEPHQVVDAVNTSSSDELRIQVYLHLEADDKEFESDDREGKWIDPDKLEEYLVRGERQKLDRREVSNFVRKLKSMPSRGDI